jgi:N-acyl amino acid synthase FeeM
MLRRRTRADEWARTIVTFESPYRLRDLCPVQPEQPGDAKELANDQQQFKIRLAHSDDRFSNASLLIQKMYSWRGYSASDLGKDPNRITLLAFDQDRIVGTVTLGLDSPIGLMVDELYKPEIDRLRAGGRRVGELTKLAVDEEIRSKNVLASLFHIAFIYGHNIHEVTDFVIEINPRHVLFYKKMLGFEPLAKERMCKRVGAPAVLMRLDLDHADHEIARLGGRGKTVSGERSIYPYFFSKQDEMGITGRLSRSE